MRKLLILMLVLGMASVANATMLTFAYSAGGTDVPQNTSITINVTADVNAQSFELGGILITGDWSSPPTLGTVDSGFTTFSSAGIIDDGSAPADVWINQVAGTAPGGSPVAIGVVLYDFTLTTGSTQGNTITIDAWAGFLPPPVLVQLNATDVNPTALVLDIIPEPMTIALLGLGGLLLRRRRKKGGDRK